MTMQIKNIPAELRALPQWVGRRRKVPLNPLTGKGAKAGEPSDLGCQHVFLYMSGKPEKKWQYYKKHHSETLIFKPDHYQNTDNLAGVMRLWVQVIVAAVTNGYLIGFVKGKIFTGWACMCGGATFDTNASPRGEMKSSATARMK